MESLLLVAIIQLVNIQRMKNKKIIKQKMKEDENAEGVYRAAADLDSFNYRNAKAMAVVLLGR